MFDAAIATDASMRPRRFLHERGERLLLLLLLLLRVPVRRGRLQDLEALVRQIARPVEAGKATTAATTTTGEEGNPCPHRTL